jgi:hypothetical protein
MITIHVSLSTGSHGVGVATQVMNKYVFLSQAYQVVKHAMQVS